MGLPEIKGGGTGGKEALFIGVTVITPHSRLCIPSTGTLPCGSVHTLIYSHTTHTHAPSLQHGGEYDSIDTADNA